MTDHPPEAPPHPPQEREELTKAVAMKKESKVWEIESGVLLNVRGFLFCGVYKSVGAGPGGCPRMNSDLIEIVHFLMKNGRRFVEQRPPLC